MGDVSSGVSLGEPPDLEIDSDSDSEPIIPIQPEIPSSPRKNKLSCLPNALVSSKEQGHRLGTDALFHHRNMDALLLKELEDAHVHDSKDLPEALFPEDAFPITLDDTLDHLLPLDKRAGGWPGCPNLLEQKCERELAAFFEATCETVREFYLANGEAWDEDRSWTADYCNTPLPGGFVPRKPDIAALVLRRALDWLSLRCDGQHKCNETLIDDITAQLHDGALNCLTAQDDRFFHVGLGMAGRRLFLEYYDRSGYIRSPAYNIHISLIFFLRVLLGFTMLSKRFLGYDPTIIHRNGKRYVTIAGKEYRILERINKTQGIRGLGTVVWRCSCDNEGFIIKSIWADRTRAHTEDEYLKAAAAADVPGIPTLVAFEKVCIDGVQVSTATIREKIGVPASDYEARDLVRLVIKERGIPIYCFSTRTELLSGLRDIVYTLWKLCVDAKILHADINDQNVMLKASATPGQRPGLLVDYNYARFLNEAAHAASAWRSLKAVFAASDLLTKGKFRAFKAHYDLQSVLYLLIWICCCYSGPNGQLRKFKIMKTELAGWLAIDEYSVGSNKSTVMSLSNVTFGNFMQDTFDKYFNMLQSCVWELRQVIMADSVDAPFAEVIQIFNKYIPKIRKKENLGPLPAPAVNPEPAPRQTAGRNPETRASRDDQAPGPTATPPTQGDDSTEGRNDGSSAAQADAEVDGGEEQPKSRKQGANCYHDKCLEARSREPGTPCLRAGTATKKQSKKSAGSRR
ncbi:hypothetical protein FB107DRAFT_274541 [Schizophyllum commune]